MVNAGVSGDTTAGGLARLDWTLTPDVDAMIVTLGGNDLLRGIDPAVSRANLDGILQAAAARDIPVLLVGMSAPGNYGPDYKRTSTRSIPTSPRSMARSSTPISCRRSRPSPTPRPRSSTYMQPDGLHPSAAGVALIVEDIGPAVLELVKAAAD